MSSLGAGGSDLPSGKVVSLTVVRGPDAGAKYEFVKAKVTLGRKRGDFILHDREISGIHASIESTADGRFIVKDLGSTNGTFLDGRRVTISEIASGQQLKCGANYMLFTVTTEEVGETSHGLRMDAMDASRPQPGRAEAPVLDDLPQLDEPFGHLAEPPSAQPAPTWGAPPPPARPAPVPPAAPAPVAAPAAPAARFGVTSHGSQRSPSQPPLAPTPAAGTAVPWEDVDLPTAKIPIPPLPAAPRPPDRPPARTPEPATRVAPPTWEVGDALAADSTPPAGVRPGDDPEPLPGGVQRSIYGLYLVVERGRDKARVFPVNSNLTVLGRSETDIVLNDPDISRRHAALDVQGQGKYVLRDLASTNGTLVNGIKVDTESLVDNDKIRMGGTTIKFVVGDHRVGPELRRLQDG